MPEIQEVFRLATQKVRPEPGFEDRQYDYRRKKERNRKLGAFAVVAAIGAAAAVLVVRSAPERQSQPAAPPAPTRTTPAAPTTRVGFIGFPPKGATPSAPERGELVLAFWTSPTRIWVYADGRVIWNQNANRAFGANDQSTGYLEQRLTPEAVELLRSEVVSTGLFDQEVPRIRLEGAEAHGVIEVRNGERLVHLEYSPGGITDVQPEQAAALVRLHERLVNPAAWMPASAWEDPEIRAYVPSAFALCFDWGRDRIGTDQLLDLLPGLAGNLLRTKHLTNEFAVHCYRVTTEEARSLAGVFDEAGYRDTGPNTAPYVLAYSVSAPDPINTEIPFSFEPILPHGAWTCSPCG